MHKYYSMYTNGLQPWMQSMNSFMEEPTVGADAMLAAGVQPSTGRGLAARAAPAVVADAAAVNTAAVGIAVCWQAARRVDAKHCGHTAGAAPPVV